VAHVQGRLFTEQPDDAPTMKAYSGQRVNAPAKPEDAIVSVVALLNVASSAHVTPVAAAKKPARRLGDPARATLSSTIVTPRMTSTGAIQLKALGYVWRARRGELATEKQRQSYNGDARADPRETTNALVNPEPAKHEHDNEFYDQKWLTSTSDKMKGQRLEDQMSHNATQPSSQSGCERGRS